MNSFTGYLVRDGYKSCFTCNNDQAKLVINSKPEVPLRSE